MDQYLLTYVQYVLFIVTCKTLYHPLVWNCFPKYLYELSADLVGTYSLSLFNNVQSKKTNIGFEVGNKLHLCRGQNAKQASQEYGRWCQLEVHFCRSLKIHLQFIALFNRFV